MFTLTPEAGKAAECNGIKAKLHGQQAGSKKQFLIKKIGLMFALLFLAAPWGHAGTLGLDIVENSSNTGTAGPQSLGWKFVVNSPILVDGLAFFDKTMTQGHDVGIYDDTTQSLLVSATVQLGDSQMGTGPWRVHSITPFALLPGTYDIAAETGSDNYTSNPNSLITAPEITFVTDRFAFGSATLTYPPDSAGIQGWFGPSFTFTTAVPEPSSITLVGIGLLALSGFARGQVVRKR
jgi:hypothetical protein